MKIINPNRREILQSLSAGAIAGKELFTSTTKVAVTVSLQINMD